MSKIVITGSQHDRTWKLESDYVPKTEKEFLQAIEAIHNNAEFAFIKDDLRTISKLF